METLRSLVIILWAITMTGCLCYVPWAHGFVGCCTPQGLSCEIKNGQLGETSQESLSLDGGSEDAQVIYGY